MDQQNKIYYDVNIPYKAEDRDSKHHCYTKAETEIKLNGPLISDPLNYDLAISKFKIDTECLPVFIPELKFPKSEDENVFLNTGEVQSNYTITAYYPTMIQPRGTYRLKRYNDMHDVEMVPLDHVEDESKYVYYDRWFIYKIKGTDEWHVLPDGEAIPANCNYYVNWWLNKLILKTDDHSDPDNWFYQLPGIDYDETIHDKKACGYYRGKLEYPEEWINVPNGHVRNDNIFSYQYSEYREQYKKKKFEPEKWSDIELGHIRDEDKYEYDDIDQHRGRHFLPDDFEACPANHVENNKIYEYKNVVDNGVSYLVYKGKTIEPQVWTNNEDGVVYDPDIYEFRQVEQYRGLAPVPEDWTDCDDDDHEYESEPEYYDYRTLDEGVLQYMVKISEPVEWKTKEDDHVYDPTKYYYNTGDDGVIYRGRNIFPEKWMAIGANHKTESDDDLFEYNINEGNKLNNAYIYKSISDYVTFFSNDCGFDTERTEFKIKNKLPSLYIQNSNYPTNTDPAYFQYDYQSVLDRINTCMERLLIKLSKVSVKNDIYPLLRLSIQECMGGAYFKLSDNIINFYIDNEILNAGVLFKFSPNLYKYIGNGFKCRFYNNPSSPYSNDISDGSFFIDCNPMVWRHHQRYIEKDGDVIFDPEDIDERDVVSDTDKWGYPTSRFQQDVDYARFTADSTETFDYVVDGARYRKEYFIYKQQYSTLCNWNVCKCILICSSSFPVKPEFYPTLKKNPTLTHYKENWYVNFMQTAYGESAYSEDAMVFDKASTKILDIYYPISSSGGDIRSCIIYTNENIEQGNKIDMVGGMDLENFDIKIKWVDLYGNVYDLYLAPGCSVNLRLCLTRKKILKDELVSAFNRITATLETIANAHLPAVDDSKTFDLKKEPPRKRNKVDLPGVLENGLIMKP